MSIRHNHPLSLNEEQEKQLKRLLEKKKRSIPEIFMEGVRALSTEKTSQK